MTEIMLVAGARTPIGSLGGALASVPAPQLAATCVERALARADVPPEQVDEVLLGNVVTAGIGQNPARQAAIKAGLATSIGATTINKVCGSGLKAVMLAAQSIRLGEASVVVAGGMENMSLAPYLLPGARSGYRLGHATVVDSMIQDGLWDVYGDRHMGYYGEQCAAKFQFTREQQDDFAIRSYTRARQATERGVFAEEIVPVEVQSRKSATRVDEDEEPMRFEEAKLRALRAAFAEEGTITAGNASSINDGAAALVVASHEKCNALAVTPQARLVASATFSGEPEWFTTAPIGAIQKLLAKVNWTTADVDLLEINEAFATVAMAAERELDIPSGKLNVYGGAVALGHPIGASGARILITLLTAMRREGARRGIAALCIGGGEAVAVAVEMR